MSDRAVVTLSSTELRRAVHALRIATAAPDDVQVSDVERDAAVSCLFELLHHQCTDLGWRPSGLTLAPWAVESVARQLARVREATIPSPRPAKASLRRPASAARRASGSAR